MEPCRKKTKSKKPSRTEGK